MVDAPILELEDITHAFAKKKTFKNINLNVSTGEIISILGESGEGKSTLLHCIAGFLPIEQGKIKLAGKLIGQKGYSLAPEKRNIGIVFQDLALFPHLNVWQNIAFSLQKNKDKIVDQMLELTNIKHIKNKYPHQISGGEQQRVALARSLACFPRLLLLDEAFGQLDMRTKRCLIDEFRPILKKMQISVIHVTHDFKEAFCFADRIAIMAEGKLAQISSPWNIYHHPKNKKVLSLLGPYHLVDTRVIDRNPLKLSSIMGTFTYPQNTSCSHSPQLIIRPEDLEFKRDGDKEGLIKEIKFIAPHREYIIDYQGTCLSISDYSETLSVKLGDKIKFSVAKRPSYLLQA